MADENYDRKSIEAQLEELRAQVRDLLNRMDAAMDKEAETLRPKLKAAQEKLNELKQTSEEAWRDLKPGLEKAWDELHKSLSQAASRFKPPPRK